jgi:hypothetical protein
MNWAEKHEVFGFQAVRPGTLAANPANFLGAPHDLTASAAAGVAGAGGVGVECNRGRS